LAQFCSGGWLVKLLHIKNMAQFGTGSTFLMLMALHKLAVIVALQ